jgi:hypothetical protein
MSVDEGIAALVDPKFLLHSKEDRTQFLVCHR